MTDDAWLPSASMAALRLRSETLQQIRSFFNQRGYWEVETPIMASAGITDVHLVNMNVTFREQLFYLQTSPEYHMKRLLAAGSGPIFQLARVFRDDELGRWHNPEFTMLEWYQLDVDHHVLMSEMEALLQQVFRFSTPMIRLTYQDAMQQCCGVDPFSANLRELQQTLRCFDLHQVFTDDEADYDSYLFLLMSHVVEPWLAREPLPVFVFDFPPSQAALAQIKNGVAERFEVYYRGVELANGFHELTDATVQAERFHHDNHERQQRGLPVALPDPHLLAALRHGLPSCSGVALGIDRLVALAQQREGIAEVLAFDISRA